MKEYDLYIPLYDNEGRRLPRRKLATLKESLVDEFGGLTHFRQKNEGLWKIGAFTFRDEIVIFRVLTDEEEKAQQFFARLKRQMEREWQQADVLIIERDVRKV